MDRFTAFVTSHTKLVVWVTVAITLVCAGLVLLVRVNYDLTAYLPASTESSRGIEALSENFNDAVPNARVEVKGVGITEALEYKERLEAVEGVSSVQWLDDVTSIAIPLEMLDPGLLDQYYRDGDALFDVAVDQGAEAEGIQGIYDGIGPDNYVTGQAVNTAEAEMLTGSETANAVLLLVPIIILILVLSTRSWAEPLFFLLAIGISIVMNFGTSIVMGEICFLTMTVSPILQLAIALDYAIFLLHAFQRFRETEPDVVTAMRKAMKKSFSSIAASAATTFSGFAALTFMRFGIGADLGFSLLKGVVFSFLSVVIFLPAFTLLAYRLIDKTQHRPLIPNFRGIGKPLAHLRIPMLCLVAIIIVPCYLAQSHTVFTYGMGSNAGSEVRTTRDTDAINDEFGQSLPSVVLVPRGDVAREAELVAQLENIPHVTSVIAYTNVVGADIPAGFVDTSVTDRFYSDAYARIIAYADTDSEGDEAFVVVDNIRAAVSGLYGDAGMTTGQTASLYDMKQTITVDNRVVNLVAIIAIFLVLLITFKSAVLPIALLATIESAIFINLAVPYFTGDSLIFVGFLIINTVQLGATVDYAILFTDNYRVNRRTMGVGPALARTLGDTFFSILVSAAILASAGLALWVTSTNNIVSILGLLLFRGTLLSLLMVVTFLPGALRLLDEPIAHTTWHARFYGIQPRRLAAAGGPHNGPTGGRRTSHGPAKGRPARGGPTGKSPARGGPTGARPPSPTTKQTSDKEQP